MLCSLLALALALGACASVSPQISVLGTAEYPVEESTVLFVEVTNPTQRDLMLSSLRYQVTSPLWPAITGTALLTRAINAGSSAIIELAVPTPMPAAAVSSPIRLDGRLFAKDQEIERSWRVSARGSLKVRSAWVKGAQPVPSVAANASQ